MAYNAIQQTDHDDLDALSERSSSASPCGSNPPSYSQLASSATALSTKDGLFLENTSDTKGVSQTIESIAAKSTRNRASYAMLEDDDYEEIQHPPHTMDNALPLARTSTPKHDPVEGFRPLHIPKPRPIVPVHAQATQNPVNHDFSKKTHALPPLPSDKTPLRTASGKSVALRHPTPDLQTLQGAYVGNIRNLEATAERLSMTSSIDDAIRDLHEEQKRSDSRRSSILSGSPLSASHEIPAFTRKSSTSSVIEMNKISRSGGHGYSPKGFVRSPKGSLASKASKYGSRPEPELEGRPLDSLVASSRYSQATNSPVMSRSASIAEVNEASGTMTLPATEEEQIPDVEETQRSKSPAPSARTFDQAQKMFADFDGVHTAQDGEEEGEEDTGRKTPSRLFAERTVSQLFTETTLLEQQKAESSPIKEDTSRRRIPSDNRLSLARPQTYADPDTGQQMVYYPAPVPMMLNLPQKLSKLPSSVARNKKRSQILSGIPAEARQSAVWLPDVMEGEGDAAARDPAIQNYEYMAQHQRTSMGGRRLTQDLEHMPPHLRANAFFEQPGMSPAVELKGHSAVETLDSILDASASAPVSAFTDHAFAGRLGEEVYGREPLKLKNIRSSTQSLSPTSEEPRKRLSTFSLFKGKHASSGDLLADAKRSSTMPGLLVGDEEEAERAEDATHLDGSDIEDFREHGNGLENEEEGAERGDANRLYFSQPTTLLAELQMRKQQQKYRTRPVATAYPNGMHSTLLELDAVAQIEQKSRKQKRVNLAWEGGDQDENMNDDDNVPLALLYANQAAQDRNRPLGLMEKKERDDNEPLSARRDRLQGRRPGMPRSTTMQSLPIATVDDENEPLAQRIHRLKAQGGTATALPTTRPVSGDFATELMSSFGDDLKVKAVEIGTSPSPAEEEETLGQRKKRLQAEREARAKEVSSIAEPAVEQPPISKRRSMADILQAHPATGYFDATVYGLSKPASGLLGLHEQQKSARRSSTMLNVENLKPQHFTSGMFNDGQGRFTPVPPYQTLYSQQAMCQPQYAQAPMRLDTNQNFMLAPFANPYAMGYTTNAMHMGYSPNMHVNPMANTMHIGLGNGIQPLKERQIDMVERWRQSVMQ